ncbi:MAG TPA: hypothetical protein VF746_28055 [Longimicrobium sp.]|jgi:hypothetical protein
MTNPPDLPDEAERRRRFFAEVNAAYDALRADPAAWEEELAERRVWEATLMDGLEDDPWYDDPLEEAGST